jgi:hypothetical protein
MHERASIPSRRLFLAGAIASGAWPLVGLPTAARGAPASAGAALTDLPQQADIRLAIIRMVDQGIMRPLAPGRFAPSEPYSLGDYLVCLQRLFNLPPPPEPVTFTDVPASSPYYAAVQAASPYLGRQMLCPGCALTTNLAPEQPVSGGEVMVSLVYVLMARGKLNFVAAGETEHLLAGVEAQHLPRPVRICLATAISAGIVKRSSAGAIDLSPVETRASVAVKLDRAQTLFQIPAAHPGGSPTY